MRKRLLAILLAFCMTTLLFPTAALADGPVEISTVTVTYTAPATGAPWSDAVVTTSSDENCWVIVQWNYWDEELEGEYKWANLDTKSGYVYQAGARYHLHIGVVPKTGAALTASPTVSINGTVTTDGVSIIDDDGTNVLVIDYDFGPLAPRQTSITSIPALNAALDNGVSEVLTFTNDLTISTNIDTFTANDSLAVANGVTLTIANGGRITSGVSNNGTIIVESGGTLASTMGEGITNRGTVTVDVGGVLISWMGGSFVNESGGETVVQSGGVFSTTMGGNIRNKGALTVAEGGEFDAWMGGRLLNDNGGTLIANGDVKITRDGGRFENSGTITGTGTITLADNHACPEDGAFSDFTGTLVRQMAEITSEAELAAALENSDVEYLCIHGDVALTQDHTVTKDITMFDAASAFTGDGRLTLVGIEYGQDFEVTPPSTKTYGLVFDLNGGTLSGFTARLPLNVNKVTLPAAPSRSGYAFNGWLVRWYDEVEDEDFSQTYAAGSELTLSDNTHNCNLTAQWYVPYTPPASEPESEPVVSNPVVSDGTVTVTTEVTPSMSGTTANATITGSTANNAVSSALEAAAENGTAPVVEIVVDAPARADGIKVTFPAAAMENLSANENASLTLTSGAGGVTLDSAALATVAEQAGTNVSVSLVPVEASQLNDYQKEAVGDAPVYDISITSGSAAISDLGGGKATVTVPYELADGQNSAGIVVYYLDDDGNIHPCETTYDPATKTVSFVTTHFSKYVVGYDAIAAWVNPFTDVKQGDWFYEDVAYANIAGLMQGTSTTTFDPHGTTTRGMIVTILYRLENKPAVTGECPFDDVASGKYYEDAVIWAAANKLVDGYGDAKFGPESPITREQLAAILWRYAKYKGYDVSVGEDTNILSYNHAFDVSEYAIPAMQWACGAGLIEGDTGNLMPQGDAERCQAAAILHRFCANIVK